MYNSDSIAGTVMYDSGNNTNITDGQFLFLEYSPKESTESDLTVSTGYYESYVLPHVNTGLGANRTYSILTTKNELTINERGYLLSQNSSINNLTGYGTYYAADSSYSSTISGSPVADAGYKLYNIYGYNSKYDTFL